nr:hypothetical protein GCM10017606_24360 [Microbacterium terregens]
MHRHYKYLGLCLGGSALLGATSPSASSPGTITSSSVSYDGGADSSGWVPFDIRANHIYLKAVVNGHEVPALLDSGASVIVINAPDAGRLGVAPSRTEIGVGVGGSTETGMARGVTVAVGKVRIKADEVAVADHTDFNNRMGEPSSITLGGEFFNQTVVDIDFGRRRLAFRKPDSFKTPPAAQSLSLLPAEGLRAIHASVEGRPATMLFDLGNGGTMYLHPRFWKNEPFMAGRRVATTYAGGFTGATPQKIAMVRNLRIEKVTFSDLPATLRDSSVGGPDDSDGNIGLPVWSRFHLVVDFGHDRLFLLPPVDKATPFAVDHVGVSVRAASDGRQIVFVAPGSPAEAAGLKTGEVIVAIADPAGRAVPLASGWNVAPIGKLFRLKLSDGRSVELKADRYF